MKTDEELSARGSPAEVRIVHLHHQRRRKVREHPRPLVGIFGPYHTGSKTLSVIQDLRKKQQR